MMTNNDSDDDHDATQCYVLLCDVTLFCVICHTVLMLNHMFMFLTFAFTMLCYDVFCKSSMIDPKS
jgi:hypothetical protein